MNDDLKNFWNDENRLKKVERELSQKVEVKKEVSINFNNNGNSKKENTINFNQKNYNKNEDEEYKPRYLITQIILNSLLFLCLYYYDSYGFLFIMILNFCLVWIYSLISILKNDFKKDSNKTVWIIALIFLPFITPYIYPDFKEIQTI